MLSKNLLSQLSAKGEDKRNKDYEKLMDYALGLVSKRRLTCYEMELRLRKKSIGVEGDIFEVIERLKELDYLDDYAFARDFISDRLQFRPRGISAIKSDLYKRGLGKDVIEHAILRASIDEEKMAREVLERKAGTLKRFPLAKQKQKLVMFLKSRGFAPNVVYKVVDEIRE